MFWFNFCLFRLDYFWTFYNRFAGSSIIMNFDCELRAKKLSNNLSRQKTIINLQIHRSMQLTKQLISCCQSEIRITENTHNQWISENDYEKLTRKKAGENYTKLVVNNFQTLAKIFQERWMIPTPKASRSTKRDLCIIEETIQYHLLP